MRDDYAICVNSEDYILRQNKKHIDIFMDDKFICKLKNTSLPDIEALEYELCEFEKKIRMVLMEHYCFG